MSNTSLMRAVAGLALAVSLAACASSLGTAATEAPAAAQPQTAAAQAVQPPPPANPQAAPFIRAIDLAPGLNMLMGAGGNMAVLQGPDGVFLIDNQFATNAEANLAAVEKLAGARPKYLVNTHWHFDHAGGNAVFQGAGTTVFAHENVRKRLSGEVPSTGRAAQPQPAPRIAWPIVTFATGVDFHLNGQTIRAFKVPSAHTDGDTMVYFVEANVLHMGDTYMKGRFPFIDTGSGGTLKGLIEAQKQVLALTNAATRIIPGHGDPATRADIEESVAMLEGASAAVAARIKAGDTLEQMLARKPLAAWTKFDGGFINADAFATVLYQQLSGK
jgi:glyoxylase-like metal-dependent hydrolase (beta-lactamase superfamily II)